MAASAASLVRATTSVARMFPAAPDRLAGQPPQPAAGQHALAQPAMPVSAAGPAQPPALPQTQARQTPAQLARAQQVPARQPPAKPEKAIRSPTGTPPPPVHPVGKARKPARRWQLAGLIIAVVVLAGALAVTVLRRPAAPPAPGSTASPGSTLLAGEAAIRGQAVAWITAQVDHNSAVACDAALCSELAQRGFPAGNLNVIASTAPDPYGSRLLIATADVRSQFASRLNFYAPTVIASFGTGAARIEVRVIAANGAGYQAAFQQDLRTRRTSGAELARNKHVTVSAAAREQLLTGDVDLRLVTALAFLATQEHVSIVAFGSFAPGAAPGVPLRWAYLAESDPAALHQGAAYLKALVTSARNLRPPYAPQNLATVHLPHGLNVLRIEFAAPSPLGLLPN